MITLYQNIIFIFIVIVLFKTNPTAAAETKASPTPKETPKDKITTTTQTVETTTAELPHKFSYKILEREICRDHHDVFLLTVVHTAPQNYQRRMLIRETWGSHLLYKLYRMVVVFFMGLPSKIEVQHAIQLESDLYHDIIQEGFMDSYKNLTYKQIMWLKWGANYCPNAQYTLKVDDDIMLNIFGLMKKIAFDYRDPAMRTKSIFCVVHDNMPVLRKKESKWYVSEAEWKKNHYSRYCSGSAVLLTQDLLRPMYENSRKTPFFWVDDFYATGLLPKGLDVTYHDRGGFYCLQNTEAEHYDFVVDGYRLFSHIANGKLMRKMWRGLATRYEVSELYGIKPVVN